MKHISVAQFPFLLAAAFALTVAHLPPAQAQSAETVQIRETIRAMEAQGLDTSAFKPLLEEAEAKDRKAAASGDASANSGNSLEAGAKCLSGSWQRDICGGTATASVRFSGGTSGSGSFSDTDCTRQCTRHFPFRYTLLSNTSMTIEYGEGQICGETKTPKGGNQAWSCSAGLLQFGNTYTR